MSPIATSLSIWINLGIWRINSSSIALHWAYFVPSRMAQKTSRQVQAIAGMMACNFVSIWHEYFVSICVVQKETWSSFTSSMMIWSCSDSARVILLHCTFFGNDCRTCRVTHYQEDNVMCMTYTTLRYCLPLMKLITSASSFLGSQKLNYYQCDRLVYNFNCKHVLVHYNRSAQSSNGCDKERQDKA